MGADARIRAPWRWPPLAGRLRGALRTLGPGFITGAADDDPSGISTYSTAGAAFGFATLWTTLFSFPLMAAVQLGCARIGLVSGNGLSGTLRRYYPRWRCGARACCSSSPTPSTSRPTWAAWPTP